MLGGEEVVLTCCPRTPITLPLSPLRKNSKVLSPLSILSDIPPIGTSAAGSPVTAPCFGAVTSSSSSFSPLMFLLDAPTAARNASFLPDMLLT